MRTVELLQEEQFQPAGGPEDWDAQEMLNALSEQVRSMAPEGCCVHGETFCLSCGLAWAVEENVPLHISSEE